MQIVALGDVGVVDGMMHIGDEAMLDALLDELRQRVPASFTVLSAAPAETAARYGVAAIDRIGFPADRAAGHARFEAVLACVAGERDLPDADPVWAVIEAVAASDGVVIAGGGNLASTWPAHIFERAALAAIARTHDRPLVVSGQTLGPVLFPDDRALVRDLLRSAALVGLREPDSALLAADLGIPSERSALTLDDASFLAFGDAHETSAPFVLVSLSAHLGVRRRDTVVAGLATALDDLSAQTGMPVRFHAHFGSVDPDDIRGDAALHDEVRAAMRVPSEVVPTGDPRDAAHLARSAGLLVTGRYHPAVFAAPAGVPIAALVVDAYTDVKLRGVLGHWQQSGLIDLDEVARGTAGPRFAAIAAQRDDIAARTTAAIAERRDESRLWWNRVAAVLARVEVGVGRG